MRSDPHDPIANVYEGPHKVRLGYPNPNFVGKKKMTIAEELEHALAEGDDDLVAKVVRWIQDEGDGDSSPSACFAVATTDEVANGLKIDAKQAYNALSRAAKKKLLTRREMRKHPTASGQYSSKEKSIGWRLWEVPMRPEQCPKD